MSDVSTLPIGPFEHVSKDYARLREEGLHLLARLGGAQWTDFNTHDPGITILEQLCYVITDLGYRMDYPMPELLAGGGRWLPGPEAILTTDPVTLADVQKLALDVDGIGNAWIEESAESGVPFYHHPGSNELRLRADPAEVDAVPVRLRGLHRVIVQTTEQRPSKSAVAAVAARLHAARGLGSDFEVSLARTYQVGLRAVLEVDAAEDPAALMAEVIERIEAYLAPKARFLAPAEARLQGRSLEEILDGPLLGRGFVEVLPEQRRTVYASDLLHAILDVPAVKAVRSLVFPNASGGVERWALEIPAGMIPALAPTAELTLLRNGLLLRVDPADVHRRLEARRAERARAAVVGDLASLPPRPRDLRRHASIQYQLPAAYGLGPLGLPASATPERRAQARQLAAYLLIFDQLFANALAQLAHAHELLSPDEQTRRTYFAEPVEDRRLGIAELRVQAPAAHRAWLDATIETGDPPDPQDPLDSLKRRKRFLERRKRFLGHLLARFAEELGDHSLIEASGSPLAGDPDELVVADRSAFLRAYPRLSRARGSGYDVSRYGSAAAGSGFEERLRHKLGLRDHVRLHVVEHVLLRPLPEDLAQLAAEGEPQVPLLAGVAGPDPWSLHVSIVLKDLGPDPGFEPFVAQTIAAETPAHLAAHLYWFGDADGVDHWSAFEAAWEDFRTAYRKYRDAKLGGASVPAERQLRVRDARDRVIDLLGFGHTYPLRDLPLPEQIIVSPGTRARIPIAFSQKGVTYELRDRTSGLPVLDAGGPITADGTGGPIELITPLIDVDVSYRILAVKQEGAQTAQRREAWLRTAVRVIEGVDPSLEARILLPLLDPQIDDPQPSNARLGDWGVEAEVEVLASQEGVTYEIIEHAADLSDVTKHRVLSAPSIGKSGRLVLRTVPIKEDIDLRVRGKKATGSPASPVLRIGILDLVLPLRVRANPAIAAQVVPPVVAYGAAAVVRLEATQPSVEYRVYRARVRDRDFVFGPGTGAPTIDIGIPGEGRTVRLERRDGLSGFVPAGEARPGNGGVLDLAIGSGADDALLLVQASKHHQIRPLGTGSEVLASMVQLDRALAVLVRPNPAPALRLEVAMASGATTGSLLVSGGQPGVLYELRLDGLAQPIARPAYFHQRDDQSDQLNKGIEQLAIGVDAVIARDRPLPAGDPRTTPPASPLLDTAPLPADTRLEVLARKVMSGLTATLTLRAVLAAVPAVTAVPARVAPGGAAKIVIAASRTDERYWLLRGGQPIGDAVAGTGAQLELSTGALGERTVFTVVMTRLDAAALTVDRHVQITVDVG